MSPKTDICKRFSDCQLEIGHQIYERRQWTASQEDNNFEAIVIWTKSVLLTVLLTGLLVILLCFMTRLRNKRQWPLYRIVFRSSGDLEETGFLLNKSSQVLLIYNDNEMSENAANLHQQLTDAGVSKVL